MRRSPSLRLRALRVGWVIAGWLSAVGAGAAHAPAAHARSPHACGCHGHAHGDATDHDAPEQRPRAPDPTEQERCALCAFLGLAADAPPAAATPAAAPAPTRLDPLPPPLLVVKRRVEPGRPRGPPLGSSA